MKTTQDKRRATGLLYVVDIKPPSPLELWAIRAMARQDMGRRS